MEGIVIFMIMLFIKLFSIFISNLKFTFTIQSTYLIVYQAFLLFFRFAYSLLQCLRVLYKEKIIHCDLKPVSDFGYILLERFCLFNAATCMFCFRVNELPCSHKTNLLVTMCVVYQSQQRGYFFKQS